MPEFGPPLSATSREQLLDRVTRLVRQAADRQEITAAEYVLEPAAAIAVDEATFRLPESMVRLATSRPEFRPPFEWLGEVTIEAAADASLRHYLIRDHDVVWAFRRNLAVIDDAEAAAIMAVLEQL